jgi:hypothetical protein
MSLSSEQVAARLAQLRALYTFEQVVVLRLKALRELTELTRYLQHPVRSR